MTEKTAIIKFMDEKGYTYQALAEKMGKKESSYVYEKIHVRNIKEKKKGLFGMRTDILVCFLNALDCELVIRDKYNKEEEYIIDMKDGPQDLPEPRKRGRKKSEKKKEEYNQDVKRWFI